MIRRRLLRGFTLVEVLVALTVLSLITVATLSAVRTIGDTNSRIVAVTERLDQMRQVSRFLRLSLRQAIIVPELREENQPLPSVIGTADTLEWFAPVQGAEGVAGLQRVSLFVGEQGALRIRFAPIERGMDKEQDDNESVVLIDRVDYLEIGYRADIDEEWSAEWTGQEGNMPQAFRLRIKAMGRYWPDLVVVPDQFRG